MLNQVLHELTQKWVAGLSPDEREALLASPDSQSDVARLFEAFTRRAESLLRELPRGALTFAGVPVDYRKPLHLAVEEVGFSYVDPKITQQNYELIPRSHPKGEIVTTTVYLVPYGEGPILQNGKETWVITCADQALAELALLGFRPANAFELFAFCARHLQDVVELLKQGSAVCSLETFMKVDDYETRQGLRIDFDHGVAPIHKPSSLPPMCYLGPVGALCVTSYLIVVRD